MLDVKKNPGRPAGSGAPPNCLVMYVGSLDPAARCGKPCVWPQYGDAGGEVHELVRCGVCVW